MDFFMKLFFFEVFKTKKIGNSLILFFFSKNQNWKYFNLKYLKNQKRQFLKSSKTAQHYYAHAQETLLAISMA